MTEWDQISYVQGTSDELHRLLHAGSRVSGPRVSALLDPELFRLSKPLGRRGIADACKKLNYNEFQEFCVAGQPGIQERRWKERNF